MTRMTSMMLLAALALGCGRPEGTGATSSAAPSTSATAVGAAEIASGDPGAGATASDSDPPPAKKWDCGARGQKACPMQKWMKRVMGPASSNGDAVKLAEALTFCATKPPPGYDDWAAISNEGAAKAKAGDVEGAKASCKKCHDAHKDHYQNTMRDRPW